MKFQTTVYIDDVLLSKILDGLIKLQCGQWIQLQGYTTKSRFVGITSNGMFKAVHNTDTKEFFAEARFIKLPLFS